MGKSPLVNNYKWLSRKEDVEAKYYADGEDAYAMKRQLQTLEAIKKEDEERARPKVKDVATKTDSSVATHDPSTQSS